MALRRRSRRLASQEREDFFTSSSIDVLGVGNDEQVFTKIESNDESKRIEEINIEKKENSSYQNSPVALRTRSRSRCSSMESNDAGISEDIQKAISIKLTPKKIRKETTPVKLCRKRTSLMPELEEIVEEQLKCIDEDNKEEKLMEGETEKKKISKKKRELLENDKTHVEVHSEKSRVEKSNKIASTKDTNDLTKPQQKIKETAWNKSDGSPKESSAKVTKKLLARNSKKSFIENSKYFLQDNVKMFLEKNPEISPAKTLQEFPKKNQKEMLTNSSSSVNDHLEGARFITEINLEENNLNIWPKLDDLLSLWLRRSEHNIFVDIIGRAYAFVNGVDPEVPSISQELILTNSETIWQQIAYGNKKFHRYFAKKKHFLDVELPTDEETDEKSDDSFSSVTTPKFKDESSDNTEEDSADLFNLTEDQIKRLHKNIGDSKMCKNDDDNYSNASNSESVCISGISDSFSKKRWKSVVDDHFFSLAEMEEYLNKQESGQAHLDENFFEQFDKDGDDFKSSRTDYHYADFYESRNNNDKENGVKSASKKLNKSTGVSQSSEVNNRTEKRVTFADDIDDDIDYKVDDHDSHGDSQEAAVLLGQVGEENNETEFQHRQKKLRERISSIEQANLAPRSWDLSGEVTAIEREENTMLEKHLDFDQSALCAPVITVDTTAQLEAKIVQRIKDRVFDDVLRTEHKSEINVTYRAPVVESETVKKSLAEVYEEQYQKTQNEIGNEEKMNEKHEEIKKLLSSLFQKLNALSHYRYIPSEVHSEVRILNNMPSLQKEEVGPLASTDAVLLAPEEIHKHVSGAFKGDDEKTKTDRSRSHRKKKKWQHIKQFKQQQIELATTKNEMLAKKPKLISQYDSKSANVKLTSASFFQHLQTKTTEKVKGKKYRTMGMDAAKKKLSTNYKL